MFSVQPLGYPNPWACSLGAVVHEQPWQLERCSQTDKHQAAANTTATRALGKVGRMHVPHGLQLLFGLQGMSLLHAQGQPKALHLCLG